MQSHFQGGCRGCPQVTTLWQQVGAQRDSQNALRTALPSALGAPRELFAFWLSFKPTVVISEAALACYVAQKKTRLAPGL